jgi:predicted nucleotidyltransferase
VLASLRGSLEVAALNELTKHTVDRESGRQMKALAEIIRRIVEVAQPEQIILFGSAARGEMRPNSDLDLLVVKQGTFHRGRLTEAIYMSLIGVGQAVNVIVVTTEDVERYRNSHPLVIAPALREGKVVYAA